MKKKSIIILATFFFSVFTASAQLVIKNDGSFFVSRKRHDCFLLNLNAYRAARDLPSSKAVPWDVFLALLREEA